MALCLKIKTTSGKQFTINVDSDLTIFELKLMCEDESETPVDLQRFLYKGRVCQDDDTIEETGIVDGARLILIKRNPNQINAQLQAPPGPQIQPQIQPGAPYFMPQQQNPFSNMFNPMGGMNNPMSAMNNMNNSNMNNMMGGMNMSNMMNMMGRTGAMGGQQQNGNPFGNFDMNAMRESMMQNPEMMEQIMQSPMMQQMMQNPDIIRNMFDSNPALQSLLDDNPQLRHILNDPSLMQHAMRAASNPDYYNELLRSNDRALQNIEALPGGFSALSRMYNQIQAPMERAMDDVYRQRHGQPRTIITNPDTSSGPTNQPMGNPWSTNNSSTTNTAANRGGNSLFNMSNMMNGFPQLNQTNRNNNSMQSFNLNNLQASQAQQQYNQPPELLPQGSVETIPNNSTDSMNEPPERPRRTTRSNSQTYAQLPPNELLRQTLGNDELRNSLRDGLTNLLDDPNTRQQIESNPELKRALSDPQFAQRLLDPSTIQTILGQRQNDVTIIEDEKDSNEMYSVQLAEMASLGFSNQEANVRALMATGGNVEAAVNYLRNIQNDGESFM